MRLRWDGTALLKLTMAMKGQMSDEIELSERVEGGCCRECIHSYALTYTCRRS